MLADSIAVIGNGVVGSAIVRGFLEHCTEVRVYDIRSEKSTHTFPDALLCDFVFVSVATPSLPDGRCDLSAVHNVMEIAAGFQGNMILRSTVPPGTTRMLADRYRIPRLLHSPEFLTARCAHTDFQCPSRNLIGHLDTTENVASAVALRQLYCSRFPGVPCYTFPAEVTELAKLAQNSFFAVKLGFFNMVYDLCQAYRINYEDVRCSLLSDGRIAHAHTGIPCPASGTRGWGGACLPKDSASFASLFKALGVPGEAFMRAVIEHNNQIRKLHPAYAANESSYLS